ncbi:MAG: radical SAM protein [Clostridia bacterium]|nr:radical SAM protein [Clostridia bacterium]
MKKIYFVQVGFEFDGSVYLPYASGTMIAYCKKFLRFKSEYEFAGIVFSREKLETALGKIKDPYLVAFSCSVWNMEYNKTLATLLKEKYPGVIINFGGHSVDEKGTLLDSEEYIDLLMFGEGERVMCSLLDCLAEGGDLSDVANIAFRKDGKTVATKREYYSDISEYPSPYTTGVFDEIIAANEGTEFLSVLETNRGCPYSCAYCDWCAGRKVRHFPIEKVYAEIEWLSKNKIAYCFCADSNFGMFPRDVDIAEKLIETKKATGYPQVFRPCYEKNSADRVYHICSALNSVGMDKGATFAYQTLSPEALKNIGRKNLTMEHFSSLLKKYNETGIPTYSELILGLPGETKESFCRGICRLIESGQHNSISVYHCEMLPNSDMAHPDYIEKHGIEVIKVKFNHIHSAIKRNEEVQEYSYLVRSTATLPREDWVYSNLFSICVQCFHSLGVLRLFAIYLYGTGRASYYDFYTSLLEYILNGSGRLNALWSNFRTKYESSLEGDWNYYNEKFGNVTWFFEEGAFIEIIDNLDSFYNELMPFLKRYFDDGFIADLLSYQRFFLRKPGEETVRARFDYNFRDYFSSFMKGDSIPLEKRSGEYEINSSFVCEDIKDYAKRAVWFGRRRGMTVYHDGEIKKTE